jgi:hypothetical protein
MASALLARLRDSGFPVPPPAPLPPEDEARAPGAPIAEDAPVSARAGSTPAPAAPEARTAPVDECRAVLVQPTTLRVSWSVRPATLEHALRAAPEARLALCVHIVQPTWEGPRPTVQCYEVGEASGEFVANDLPRGCVVRAAVGCLDGTRFAPFAHSGASETRVQVH